MPAYAIMDVEIHDLEQYLDYMKSVRPVLEACGATYLVRGGAHQVLEGAYEPHRLVVVEFPSMQALTEFYQSQDYRALEARRLACSSAQVVAVQGIKGSPSL